MKLYFLVLLGVVYSVSAIPSKEAIHGAHTYSVKNGFQGHSFVREINEGSFGAYDGLNLDPEIELVSDDDEHVYKDFSDVTERYDNGEDNFHEYEGYEDVIPAEVRFSGQSVETEDVSQYERDGSAKDNTEKEDKNGSTRELRRDDDETEVESERRDIEDNLDMDEESAEDVKVKGQSDPSPLEEDRLPGLNEVNAPGAMKGADRRKFDSENNDPYETLSHSVQQEDEKEMSYRELYEGGIDEEGMEHQDLKDLNYEDEHEQNDMNQITVRGQAIEHETNGDFEYEDYDDDEEAINAERFEDEDWDDDDDDDFNDDNFDSAAEIDHDVHSVDINEEDDYDYDYDEFEDDDEEYSVRQAKKKKSKDTRVKGMQVKGEDGDEEDFSDGDMDEIVREEGDEEYYESNEQDEDRGKDGEKLDPARHDTK